MKKFCQTKLCAIVAFLVFCCNLVVVCCVPAYADEQPKQRLQISPAIQEVGELKPGDKYTGTFKVQNTGTETFDFNVGVSPFFVVDENYTPDYDNSNQYTDITEWIKLSITSGTVTPNNEKEIAYSISVPADVPAGGQYAVIYAEIIPSESAGDTGIAAVQRVGMKIYSNVQGNTRKTAAIDENKIAGILFNPPITATSIVHNTGNTHARATYVLQVYPLFSSEEVYTNEENPVTLTILPETRRFNSVAWEGAPRLGIFKVKQTVTIFGETSTTEKVVFLIPLWFLFLILLIIFVAIFWLVSRIRNRNKY